MLIDKYLIKLFFTKHNVKMEIIDYLADCIVLFKKAIRFLAEERPLNDFHSAHRSVFYDG